uniref:Derlin n=1 Tax=Octopus bimaculoides TaxID=37653 RepID=A0A0L8GQK8_OCTBM
MASNDIGDWFRSIPRITKFWFVGSIVLPIAARFGLLSPIWLILRYEFVVYKFQLIGLTADLLLLMDPMVLSVLYIWCQLNKDTTVTFWFGTRFPAMYLPWVLLGFNLIVGDGGLFELIGILVGHLYFFLKFKYPQDFGGPQLITTPQFLYKYFPSHQTWAGFGEAPRRRFTNGNQGGEGGHTWGRGQTLGGN